MTRLSDTAGVVRERVLNGLALFVLHDHVCSALGARHTAQPVDAASEVDSERVAFDLIRFWFDSIYTPGLRYMDGLKGDRDQARVRAFREAFGDEEVLWLERFNRFLELRVDRLSARERDEERFPAGDTWTAIKRDARNLLQLMDSNRADRIENNADIETLLRSGFRQRS